MRRPKQKRILLIDDENERAEPVKAFLENNGFQVDVDHNHVNAISRLSRDARYDLILSDCDTNCDIEGVQFMQGNYNRDIPVITFSENELGYTTMLSEGAVDVYRPMLVLRGLWAEKRLQEENPSAELEAELKEDASYCDQFLNAINQHIAAGKVISQ